MIRRARGPALVLGDQALVSGAQFLTTVILVRELGLEVFGAYSLLWLIVLLAVALQQALISQPAMAIAPSVEPRTRDTYLGTLTTLEVGFTSLCAILTSLGCLWTLAHWTVEPLRATWPALVAATAARQLHVHVRAGFFLRGRRVEALWNDGLAYGGQLAGLGLAWATGTLDLAVALWAVAVGSGLASMLGLARQGAWCTDPVELRATASRHWRSGRWLAALQGLRFFASNAFVVAGGALLGVAAVGALKAAQTVIGVLHVGMLAIENVIPIRAAHELARGGRSALLGYLGRLGLRAGALLGIGVALLAWSPRGVLHLVYDAPPSPELVLALRGMCVLYLFALVITLEQIAFRSLEHTRPIFVASALNLLLALVAAEPIVRHYGFGGMVTGMVVQQAMVAGGLALFLIRAPRVSASVEARGQ